MEKTDKLDTIIALLARLVAIAENEVSKKCMNLSPHLRREFLASPVLSTDHNQPTTENVAPAADAQEPNR